MKIHLSLLFAALFVGSFLSAQTFKDSLEALPGVVSVEKMETGRFESKYLLTFEQPLDHRHPEKGSFQQRVFLGHIHPDSVNIVVTEGYDANRELTRDNRTELSEIFNANDIVVEHRFFSKSTPEPCDWEYLTAENAAADHHRVVTALKQIYKGKWISTGISKGGQTCALYRYYYPEDVDITVPYVAPFCHGQEDGRHERFIAEYCGTSEDRARILDFQMEFLKRRERLQPRFDTYCDSVWTAEGLHSHLPKDQVYDYCALEFSFAFWQWGYPVEDIPLTDASDEAVFDYMMNVAGPDYFVADSRHLSFYVQAAKELGYYGYDTRPFAGYLHISSSEAYLHTIFLPDELAGKLTFDTEMYRNVCRFLRHTDARMLFIYGQYDPWSSVSVNDYWSKSLPHSYRLRHHATGRTLRGITRDNLRVYVQPGGSHRARIRTFDDETSQEIVSLLKKWVYEE